MRGEIEAALVRACRSGRVTLVLGAGISACRGVPLWGEVVQRLVEAVTGDAGDRPTLQGVREVLCRELGAEAAGRLHLSAHPLEPQLMLEWVRDLLEQPEVRGRVAGAVPELGRLEDPDELFVALVRWALYDEVDDAGDGDRNDALAVVTDAILAQTAAGDARKLIRVVTLNADDLIEREAARRTGGAGLGIAPVTRPSEHPAEGDPPPIPIYHLHGYLPREPADPLATPDRLVFTDAQFWSTTANPMSFANRVVAHALHDSRCVFAGLSMRDANLLRWLAVCYAEMASDLASRDRALPPRETLQRHFWIHAAADDASGILRDVLARRGVRSVEIGDWASDEFAGLMRACFAT